MPSDSFLLNRWILSVAGFWPSTANNNSLKVSAYKVYSILSIISVQVGFLGEVIAVKDSASSLDELVMQMVAVFAHSSVMFKAFLFYLKRQNLLQIANNLDSDEFTYKPIKGVDFEEETRKIRKIILRNNRIFLCFVGIAVSVTSAATAMVYLKTPSSDFALNGGTKTCSDIFFLKMWFPSMFHSRAGCGVAIVLQSVMWTLLCAQVYGADAFIMAILYRISAHFEIAQKAFKTIRTTTLRKLGYPINYSVHSDRDDPFLEEEMNNQMKECVKYLQKILKICLEVESSFTQVNLVVVLTSSAALGFCLCLLKPADILKGELLIASYVLTLVFQLGLYTSFGEVIISSSEKIPNAIYSCDWYSASSRFKKNMLINMRRFRRPIYVTVGKFSPLTLPMFASIMKFAYSFYSAYNAMKK